MTNNSKLYKQAAKWIKKADAYSNKTEDHMHPMLVHPDLVPDDFKNKYFDAAYRAALQPLISDPYYSTLPREELNDIAIERALRLIRHQYDADMRSSHWEKMDSNSETYDPAYAAKVSGAYSEFMNYFNSPDFQQNKLTYTPQSYNPVEPRAKGLQASALRAMDLGFRPVMAYQFAAGYPNITPKNPSWWSKSKIGVDFWPIPDLSDDGSFAKHLEEARAHNASQLWRDWESISTKPKGATTAAKAYDVAGRVGRLPRRFISWTFNRGLLPIAAYGQLMTGYDHFKDALNADSSGQAAYSTTLGALDSALGLGIAGDLAARSPALQRATTALSSKLPFLLKWGPQATKGMRFLSAASGPLFAAEQMARPTISWAENSLRGLPVMERYANKQLGDRESIAAALEYFKYANENGEITPLYKQTVAALAKMRDTRKLPETQGYWGLYGPALKYTMEQFNPETNNGDPQLRQLLLGGDREKITYNPFANLYWRKWVGPKLPKDGKFTGAINSKYTQMLNSNPDPNDYYTKYNPQTGKYEYDVKDDLYPIPQRNGGVVYVPGKTLYGQFINSWTKTDYPSITSHGTNNWSSAAMVGSDPAINSTLAEIHQENHPQPAVKHTPNPDSNDQLLGSPLIPAI